LLRGHGGRRGAGSIFSYTCLIVALAKMKKGRVHYNRLFFSSEEVSVTTNFVCSSIPYDELRRQCLVGHVSLRQMPHSIFSFLYY
jgi:hypothetical protein